jgi:hypothetical protein
MQVTSTSTSTQWLCAERQAKTSAVPIAAILHVRVTAAAEVVIAVTILVVVVKQLILCTVSCHKALVMLVFGTEIVLQ